MMTNQQQQQIATLGRKLGLGNHATQAIKSVLGKMPVNLSDARAEAVIEELHSRWDATEEGQAEADEREFRFLGEDRRHYNC